MQTDISNGKIFMYLNYTYISLFERFSSESRGLSKDVNISKAANNLGVKRYVPNDRKLTFFKRLHRHPSRRVPSGEISIWSVCRA